MQKFFNNYKTKKALSWILPAVTLATVATFAFHHIALADQANDGLVNCDGITTSEMQACDWNKFVELINRIIKFLVFDLSLPVCAILFIYAGWKMMTAQGDKNKFAEARKIFTRVVIGFVIVLSAYFVVKLILSAVGFQDKTGLFA